MADESSNPPMYGGRALYNGVLMVGPESMAVAIRQEDGSIATAVRQFRMPFRWARQVPFLRGLLSLAGAVVLALRSSALERSLVPGRSRGRQWLSLAAPAIAGSILERIVGAVLKPKQRPGSTSPGPGVLTLLVPFMAFRLTGLFGPGRELLRYHAAEHMAVNAAEAGLPMAAATVRSQSRIHPRCGTTFAFWALLIGSWLTKRSRGRTVASVITGPVVVSTAYEIVRLGAAHREKPWAKILFGASWQAQRLTTSAPNLEHVEVACAALQSVMTVESGEAPAPTALV